MSYRKAFKKHPYSLPGIEGSYKAVIAKEAVDYAATETSLGLPGLVELCDEIRRQAMARMNPPLVMGGNGLDTQVSILEGGEPMPPLVRDEEEQPILGGLRPSPKTR